MFKKPSFTTSFNKKRIYNSPIFILLILLISISILFFYLKDNNNLIQNNNNTSSLSYDIEKWIMDNPEKILESIQKMQEKQMQKMLDQARANIKNKKTELYKRDDPQIAPKDYDVTIVEFSDYNCKFCKRASSTIEKLVAQDKKVRVIFKEYPILSESSNELAIVGLAVHMAEPKKYLEYHKAVMDPKNSIRDKKSALRYIKNNTSIKSSKVIDIIKNKSNKIQKIIDNNRELAASIGVTGTPAFVIGEELIPGAISLQQLQEKIENIRDNN